MHPTDVEPAMADAGMPADAGDAHDAHFAAQQSTTANLRGLIADGKATLRGEIDLAIAASTAAATAARGVAVWGIAALLVLLAGLVTLFVGGMLLLAGVIGPLAAYVVMIGIILSIAALAGLAARRAAHRLVAIAALLKART